MAHTRKPTTDELSLLSASRQGAEWLVAKRLDQGISPNVTNSRGLPPLHFAVAQGHVHTVRTLLERGADPRAFYWLPNGLLCSPLETAAGTGQLECLTVLLEAGVSLHGGRIVGRRALHYAAGFRHPDTVRWLLGRGANPNQRELGIPGFTFSSLTPAMYAAISGDLACLTLLADAGADLHARRWTLRGISDVGRLAALRGHEPVVQWLRDRAV